MSRILTLEDLDEYGRIVYPGDEPGGPDGPAGWVFAPHPGPVIPPPPPDRRPRAAGWPPLLHRLLVANPLCRGCGHNSETGHHIKPYHEFPQFELVPENVVCVCVACHFVICHCNNWTYYVPTVLADLDWHRTRVDAARKLAA
jgi:hypothetical protein